MSQREANYGEQVPNGGTLGDCAALFTRERIGQVSSQRVSTGFEKLDRCLNGGLANGLYVLGAVPGLGKSTLALQIAYHLSGQGYPVLYFALEMNRAWITAKTLCREDFIRNGSAAFLASDLLDPQKSGRFSQVVWERVNRAREEVERAGEHFYLYEQGPRLTHIGQIREQIHTFRQTRGERYGDRPMLVVVDYLQILAPRVAAQKLSDKQIVDDNVRELCRIRDQEGVIILLISALNRGSYNRAITLESFKESGSIEYSADVILGMQYQGLAEGRPVSLEQAKAQRPRKLELTLLKMRYGQDGVRIPLDFYSESSCFCLPEGEGAPSPSRLKELREKFRAYPVQYHDGRFRNARRWGGEVHG